MKATSTLHGAKQTRAILTGAAAQMVAQETPRHVGTVVKYARYLEYGTSRMRARPFFRPAVAEMQAKGLSAKQDFARDAGGRFTYINSPVGLYTATAGRGILRRVAGQLTRIVRKWIRAKRLIDTGNLLGSIAEGDSRQEMEQKSQSRLILPDSSALG